MVFQHKGYAPYLFQGLTRNGWRQLSTRTPHKPLAREIVRMWRHLAEQERAWDITDRVPRTLGMLALLDLYRATNGDLAAMRDRLSDTTLREHIGAFGVWYREQVQSAESVRRATRHAELLAEALPRWSDCTGPALSAALSAVTTSASTKRIVHANWTTFLGFIASTRSSVNPMATVARPKATRPPFRLLGTFADVVRLIEHQPTPERRAFFALMYGAAQDVSPALAMSGGDLTADRVLRVWGSKTAHRNRSVQLDEWAMSYVWPVTRTHLYAAQVFPWHRRTVSGWHRDTARSLGLPDVPLRNARHWWAVDKLRDQRWSVRRVMHQLGHATAKMTLDTYGAWLVDVQVEDDNRERHSGMGSGMTAEAR